MLVGTTRNLHIRDEFSRLRSVIIGLAAPYQRDKSRIAEEMREFPQVPDTDRKAEVLALDYPDETLLLREYADFVELLESHAVEVLRADPAAAYSFDYTCPRDIGFVVGERFFIANMAVPSRVDEIDTIAQHLAQVDRQAILRPPPGCLLEGGDVIVLDARTVLVGYHQRSNRKGYEFLRDTLSPEGIDVYPLPHRRLHLDCCLNPLGMGHLLIHPASLAGMDRQSREILRRYSWIEVDAVECEHLATNVLSIDSSTIVARDHASCRRVNRQLESLGYRVEAIGFDGVPATGGSFRCASLALARD